MSAELLPSPATGTGWHARLELGLARRRGRTVLAHRAHRGPAMVQRPFYPEGETCHLYLLHPPGGLVAGDVLETHVALEPGARALLTTPAAAKVYRSEGPVSRVDNRLRVGADACLEWMPQETIVYDGARAHVRTRVELDASARFVGWEVVCLGRPAADERFAGGWFRGGFELWLGEHPLVVDRLRVDPAGPMTDAAWGLGRAPVTATMVAWPVAAEVLPALRAAVAGASGAGRIGLTLRDSALVARYLGPHADDARGLLEQTWTELRPRLLGAAPCPPRIWAT